jgi:predicted DNA-binding transcriptional regulator AlpA
MRLVDIAKYLGVSKQRAYQLAGERGFPRPAQRLRSGRRWEASAIRAWARREWWGSLPWRFLGVDYLPGEIGLPIGGNRVFRSRSAREQREALRARRYAALLGGARRGVHPTPRPRGHPPGLRGVFRPPGWCPRGRGGRQRLPFVPID